MTRTTRAAWACWSALLAFSSDRSARVSLPVLRAPSSPTSPGPRSRPRSTPRSCSSTRRMTPDAGVDPRRRQDAQVGRVQELQGALAHQRVAQKSAPTATSLPNGRTLQISLKDVKDGRFRDRHQHQSARWHRRFCRSSRSRAVGRCSGLHRGPELPGGMLIIAIKILPH